MTDSKNSPATPGWLGAGDPMPVPDTSMLPPVDEAALVGDDMLKRVVQGAHASIDRLAEGVAPTVRQLEGSVSRAENALRAGTDQIRETRDEWSESLRATVRKNPLASLVGALAIGALIARITR